MGDWKETLGLIDTLLSLAGVILGLFIAFLRDRIRRWWRLRGLRQAAKQGAVALCIRAGGRSDPLPDAESYLREHHPSVDTLLTYSAPAAASLDDPAVAQAIIEDLREAMAEYGSQQLSEVHLFYAGMVAYPFALGALLSNWAPVVVYHLKEGRYIPLYRLTKEGLQTAQRSEKGLARMQVRRIRREGRRRPQAAADEGRAPVESTESGDAG